MIDEHDPIRSKTICVPGGLCFPLKLKSIDPLLGTVVMGKIKKHLLPNNLYVLVHIELWAWLWEWRATCAFYVGLTDKEDEFCYDVFVFKKMFYISLSWDFSTDSSVIFQSCYLIFLHCLIEIIMFLHLVNTIFFLITLNILLLTLWRTRYCLDYGCLLSMASKKLC